MREKTKKKYILKNLYAFFDGRERVLRVFKSRIFPIKRKGKAFSDLGTWDKIPEDYNLKIVIPKQMLPRLPVAFTQIKAGNTSGNLLNKIILEQLI